MAITNEGIMVLLQGAIEETDSKDLRALLEEAIKAPGPHHLANDSEQADPRVHVVLTTNDGATFLPKRGFIMEHSGLIRDLLAGAEEEVAKEAVPLPNVVAPELTRMLWLLQQGFNAKQLERCIAAFEIDGVVALQEAANFMDVRCITAACGGVIARRVQEAVDDEERAQLLELVTPPRLPQELCELWLGRYSTDADELLELVASQPDQLLAPLAHWDAVWSDKGCFSEHLFKLSDETEFTLLKARAEVIEHSQGASFLKVRLHADTNDDHLDSVREVSVVTSLNMCDCNQITDASLEKLKELPQLTSLNLERCAQITDAALLHIKKLTQLTVLDLSGCLHITDVGLANIKELAQLTELDLAGYNITDTCLAHVKELKQLTELNLRGCSNITDVGLLHVKDMPHLMTLTLSGYFITNAGLAHLKELAQLTVLNLNGRNQITDSGLAHVKELTQLTTLKLMYCDQITEAGLVHVKDMAQLTSLSLERCGQMERQGKLCARLLTADVDASALPRADVKWKLPDGTTLLHVAAQKNRRKAVALLLERGADVNAVNDQGRTPLQLAIEASATDAALLLQQKGV